jgi:hypothetical protein
MEEQGSEVEGNHFPSHFLSDLAWKLILCPQKRGLHLIKWRYFVPIHLSYMQHKVLFNIYVLENKFNTLFT